MNICYCLSMLNWIFGKDMLNRFDKYDQNKYFDHVTYFDDIIIE